LLSVGVARDVQDANDVWILGPIIWSWITFLSLLVMRVSPEKKKRQKRENKKKKNKNKKKKKQNKKKLRKKGENACIAWVGVIV